MYRLIFLCEAFLLVSLLNGQQFEVNGDVLIHKQGSVNVKIGSTPDLGLEFKYFNMGLNDIPGSTFGMQIVGPDNSHIIMDIKGNDGNDGFYIRRRKDYDMLDDFDVAFSVASDGKVKVHDIETDNSDVKNVVIRPDGSLAQSEYKVGDYAFGGIVYWVDDTGGHGLIVSLDDQSTGSGQRWNAGTSGNTQAKGEGIMAGEMNTSIIIAAHVAIGDDGSPYAARSCAEYTRTMDGVKYGNWYLPSRDELILLAQRTSDVNDDIQFRGGMAIGSGSYWSSNEQSSNMAYSVNMNTAGNFANVKTSSEIKVRAIKAF